MPDVRTIHVFIASPGDLAVERRAFKDVIDDLRGKKGTFYFFAALTVSPEVVVRSPSADGPMRSYSSSRGSESLRQSDRSQISNPEGLPIEEYVSAGFKIEGPWVLRSRASLFSWQRFLEFAPDQLSIHPSYPNSGLLHTVDFPILRVIGCAADANCSRAGIGG
jgi:hypothetical protein